MFSLKCMFLNNTEYLLNIKILKLIKTIKSYSHEKETRSLA